jgi:hypothetical protein
MKKIVVIALVVCVGSLLNSCATILASKTDPVTISCTPDSSKVFVNGQFMGYTPVKMDLPRSNSQLIEIKHDGYEPQQKILHTTIHPLWIGLDVLLTAGIGAMVDAATGAWNIYQPDVIIMDLSKL